MTSAAALVGSFGLAARITGNTPSYVQDNSPTAETVYNARFWFNPNGTITGSGATTDILVGLSASNAVVFRIQYRRQSASSYQVRAVMTRSGGTTATAWLTISNAAHSIEIAWAKAASSTATLYVDGVANATLTNLNTNALTLESIRLGPSGGLASGMSGTERFDAFASSRTGYIGP